MGTYHSYAGDAKLEDSKDNWYRISGMNLYTRNITTFDQTRTTGAAWLGGKESVLTTLLFKTVPAFKPEDYPLNSNFQIYLGVIGNTFNIKDRSLSNTDIIAYGTYHGDNIRGITGKNMAKDQVNNVLYPISVNEARLFNARPDNTDWPTCFRPMLTLKPVGGGGN